MIRIRKLFIVSVLVAAPRPAASQQAIDNVYTARIRELTPTDRLWKFNTDLVETLTASSI